MIKIYKNKETFEATTSSTKTPSKPNIIDVIGSALFTVSVLIIVLYGLLYGGIKLFNYMKEKLSNPANIAAIAQAANKVTTRANESFA
jgi:hypothetical protein